ncbi:hypothetical protein PVBG_04757 [Plasmodium vivax Brazil I]|uniref:Uncharacterized protein n=1 Tax=Plasmodium vivax (strain Brazil I) TaxID=1033975 RepID=A0A0J9VN37_PLAV1|nr:hypothetical protein PVBG_04757 [Plasmodium vivax Brazil I]
MVAAYEEFNKDVIDEEKKIGVTLIRNAKRIVGYRDMDNHVYEKLIRNLSKLLNQEYRKISNTDYCAFLYQWVHHIKKKYNIDEYFIGVFYGAIHDSIVQAGAKKNVNIIHTIKTMKIQ